MSLTDEIVEIQARQKKCGLGDAIRTMDEELAHQVIECLHNPAFQSTAITQALKKKGYRVNRFQVSECRKTCECGAICGR